MITDFDDYLIHQAALPINQMGIANRNAYDRYWFNGFDKAGTFLFEAGFGRYPNRFVQDAHFSVAFDGVQHSFHASRRVPDNPMDSSAGPMRVEVVHPMRVIRIVVEPNDTEVECELTFHAKAPPVQEPKNHMWDGNRLIMDTQRFTQYGTWEGFFSVKGRRFEVKRSEVIGLRDKSWGMRPVGEYEEDVVEPNEEVMASATNSIQWISGTRWPSGATLGFEKRDGTKLEIELEPIFRFQMMGIGYQHPEWGHAVWRDELEIGYESWKLDEVEPDEYCSIHVHNVVRAKMGEKTGIGILETIVFGRHEPSGFQDLFDGAP
jgi:hypothetical protein